MKPTLLAASLIVTYLCVYAAVEQIPSSSALGADATFRMRHRVDQHRSNRYCAETFDS